MSSINFYKSFLAINFLILAVLIGIQIFLFGNNKNTISFQQDIESSNISKQDNYKSVEYYPYWRLLEMICKKDSIVLNKLENNAGSSNIIKADIKILGKIEKLEESLDYIISLSDSINIKRVYFKEEREVKSSIISLEFLNNK